MQCLAVQFLARGGGGGGGELVMDNATSSLPCGVDSSMAGGI